METASPRQGGILLHITSLPGPEGVGTLGAGAYRFIDFLAECGMRVWQVLPVGPVGYGESPYQSACAMAGNPLLIDLQTLAQEGLLPDYAPPALPQTGRADYETARKEKEKLLRLSFAHMRDELAREGAYARWTSRWPWLRDYALFMAVKEKFGNQSWMRWPDEDIRLRKPAALARYGEELRQDVCYHMYVQSLFYGQWERLHAYARDKGVALFGDMPIYVAEDSSDVWANARYFQLDASRRPTRVAGVPPDYFSADGQLWGNPLYRWGRLRLSGYDFWIRRLNAMGQLFDRVRVDHFIGFANYYSVEAGSATARVGKWVKGPGRAFFRQVKRKLPQLQIVAEDLGAVNARVRALLAYCGYPGMKVLQFGFDGGGDNPNALDTFTRNCVAYTGTHDNDTTLGWWKAQGEDTRRNARAILGDVDEGAIVPRMIEAVFASPADTAIAPMQDFLGLDTHARMNLPGTVSERNWRYRALEADLSPALATDIRRLLRQTERL